MATTDPVKLLTMWQAVCDSCGWHTASVDQKQAAREWARLHRVTCPSKPTPPAEPLVVEQPERVPCPDCNGTGKIASTVPGVPASVCVRYTSCERCWPKDESGQRKPWDDGTAGTIPAPQVEQPEVCTCQVIGDTRHRYWRCPIHGLVGSRSAPVEPETDR